MTNGIYKTALGKVINMDTLRLQNEQERAVGNMGINARGDKIAADGTIVKSSTKRVQEQYKHQAPVDLNKQQPKKKR